YCRRCGHQLKNGMKFCTRCGARLDLDDIFFEIKENITPSASLPSAEASQDTVDYDLLDPSVKADDSAEPSLNAFVRVMDETKKKSRSRMRVVVLVTLAALLLSGIAYAAYYVYTQAEQPRQDAPVIAEAPEVTEEQKNTYTYTMAKIENEAAAEESYLSFSYPVFSSSEQNQFVEEVNEHLKRKVSEGYARRGKEYETIDEGRYVSCDMAVSLHRDNIVALRTEKSVTLGGVHGMRIVEGLVVNLDTGKMVAPEDFFQIDKNDLRLRTAAALKEYTENNPNAGYWDDIDKAIAQTVEGGALSYYITDAGLVVETASYSLGRFSIGHQIALVIPFGEIPEAQQA
ncbi:MAG: zinc ribbon domain-containing protein, partial [Raoultibacter sp.]